MIIHILFILGIIIMITGWFFDRAKFFKWIMLKVASDYIFAKQAIDDLEKDQKIALTKHHEGFEILINKWPNLSKKESVEYIGRSVAFVSFGSKVENDIQIMAYDKDKKEIKERWSMLNARSTIEGIAEKKLFKIGVFLFWGGIVISVASHIASLSINS